MFARKLIKFLNIFHSKFAVFTNFEKVQVYLEKFIAFIFFKKKQILYILRNFTILVAFYGKLAII